MLKVCVIGAGSSYTPELIEGFIKRYKDFPIEELYLNDIEEGKEKLDIIYELTKRMFAKANIKVNIVKTLNQTEAIKESSFVLTQFRVGGLKAREKDEYIPNKYNNLGQETNGAGGHFKALRTIPYIEQIIKNIERNAPNAWIINFTNPAGMVSEYVNRYTTFKRFIGVCNCPINMRMDVAKVLDVNPFDLDIDFVGLNHMVFITKISLNGKDVLQEAIQKVRKASMKNIVDLEWNLLYLQEANIIPCPYLRYYLKKEEMLKHQMEEFKEGKIRSQVVQTLEKELFIKYQDKKLDVKPKELESRGGAYYSGVACDICASIYSDKKHEHVVNIKNNGHVSNIDVDVTIEISATIGINGPTPKESVTYIPKQIKGIIEQFKAYELLTCEAIYLKDKNKAIHALMLSPYNTDIDKTQVIFEELYKEHIKYVDYLK